MIQKLIIVICNKEYYSSSKIKQASKEKNILIYFDNTVNFADE